MRLVAWLSFGAVLVVTSSCTTIDEARAVSLRVNETGHAVFATAEDLAVPYDSLGPIQVTHRGVLLFGFLDPAGTDLQSGFENSLFPEVRRLGGDAVINVRFERTAYTLPTRILAAFLFIAPLPTEMTITGEVVRIRRATEQKR